MQLHGLMSRTLTVRYKQRCDHLHLSYTLYAFVGGRGIKMTWLFPPSRPPPSPRQKKKEKKSEGRKNIEEEVQNVLLIQGSTPVRRPVS